VRVVKATRKAPTTTAPVIDPRAVFRRETLTKALGLARHTIAREIREGRLRAARRGGWYFILGSWVLQWLEAGEVHRQQYQRSRVEISRNGKGEDD
jgi:hypothetical protein